MKNFLPDQALTAFPTPLLGHDEFIRNTRFEDGASGGAAALGSLRGIIVAIGEYYRSRSNGLGLGSTISEEGNNISGLDRSYDSSSEQVWKKLRSEARSDTPFRKLNSPRFFIGNS